MHRSFYLSVTSMLCLTTGLVLLLAEQLHAQPDTNQSTQVDLAGAVIVIPPDSPVVLQKAAEMLHDEIWKRTRLELPVETKLPEEKRAVILLGPKTLDEKNDPARTKLLSQLKKKDSYALWIDQQRSGLPTVTIVGKQDRGVLFGVGKLLRLLEMRRDRLSLASNTKLATAPRCELRGHQLGYRPKVNTYDAWSLREFEQYIRDLVVFGTNAIEILPPKTDDYKDSPHFQTPKLEMMIKLSRLIDAYDLDVWIWYPAIDGDYTKPDVVEQGLERRAKVLALLPRVDAVFIPGGDPGRTAPPVALQFAGKTAQLLRKRHPQAKVWISWQGYRHPEGWLESFYKHIKDAKEIDGVVYGPWTQDSLKDFRKNTPSHLPMRLYPDITHSIRCQYPVPDWDPAFQYTQHREVINPRPRSFTEIFRETYPGTAGFLAYSEGVNDDVNKILWSNLGWDPSITPEDSMREYAKYFIGPEHADTFAKGLLGLEKNWQGPLLKNEGVPQTLKLFQQIEKSATPQQKRNWRLQMALYRAYYDAYVQARLIHEISLQKQAAKILRNAKSLGTAKAIAEADQLLTGGMANLPNRPWRARIHELGEALFQSIGMQLSVPRYHALSYGRGANLDLVDNRVSQRKPTAPFQVPPSREHPFQESFANILKLSSSEKQLVEIEAIIELMDPVETEAGKSR